MTERILVVEDEANIASFVSAYLEKRLFVEGSEVKNGDLLYLLEQPPFQAQVDADKANVAQLEAQHTYAAQQLERAQYLLKTPAGQQQNVDQTVRQSAVGNRRDQSRLYRDPRADRR